MNNMYQEEIGSCDIAMIDYLPSLASIGSNGFPHMSRLRFITPKPSSMSKPSFYSRLIYSRYSSLSTALPDLYIFTEVLECLTLLSSFRTLMASAQAKWDFPVLALPLIRRFFLGISSYSLIANKRRSCRHSINILPKIQKQKPLQA